jgi:hypothetical protein
MKFKTTEWTITAAAAAHVVRQAGNTKMAAHLDDLAAWLLLNLAALEKIPDDPPFDADPPRPTNAPRAWFCHHCRKWHRKPAGPHPQCNASRPRTTLDP